MKEIEITIAPDGTVSAVIAGVKGPACKVLAQELAQIIGEEVSFSPSSEYFEPEEQLDVEVGEK